MGRRNFPSNALVLAVDPGDVSWFAVVVQMNVSMHKPDTSPRPGDAKKLNPDDGGRSGKARIPVMREDPTDEQLLAEYRGGDKTKFAVLVLRYQRELYHFLVRFLGDRAAAEDVFQETFLQVH